MQQAERVPAGSKVLDVGAGAGPYRHYFDHCQYSTHDFGAEPSTLGRYAPLDYQSDVSSIPVETGSFDVILCTEVLEHVPEPIVAVREFARILKAGGRLILTAPLGSWLHQEPYHFYGGYTPHWYERFLAEAGFVDISVKPNGGFFAAFAQEGRRWSALIDPRRTGGVGLSRRAMLLIAWALTAPLLRGFFPLLAEPLDRLSLVDGMTVGYHVTATRSAEVSE